MKPAVTWILLANGAQAKVFAHHGAGTGLTSLPDLMFAEEPLRAGEIMSDRPGRSFSSGSDGRSAMEYSSDPVAVRELRFVRSVAEALDRQHQQSAFSRLIIAAAPAALGDLRNALSDPVRQTVVAEMDKDLTNLPTDQLEKHFKGVLAM